MHRPGRISLKIVIEHFLEWQLPLYIDFVDFEKAFGRVDDSLFGAVSNTMDSRSSSPASPKEFKDDATCLVIHNEGLTEAFEVQIGVRQGCLLSPLIFLIVLDSA